jgi:hypothetical protein
MFGDSATNVSLFGGSAPATIFGAQSGEYFLGSGSTLFVGSPSVGSAATIFGGESQSLVFTNSSSLSFIADTNEAATIVGGSVPSTLFGAAGAMLTYYSTTSGALMVAGSGSETLNAVSATSNVTMFAGNDPLGATR